jgi:hypothetical protein
MWRGWRRRSSSVNKLPVAACSTVHQATLGSERQGVDEQAAATTLSPKCRRGEEPVLRRAGGSGGGDVEPRTRETDRDAVAGGTVDAVG